MPILKKRELYHITSTGNLDSIIADKAILSKNLILQLNKTPQSIAYELIQDRRARKTVPLPPYGVLHDYVPFYFCPRPPMLYGISCGNIHVTDNGQKDILHLVTSPEVIQSKGYEYIFTDGHAVMDYFNFYNDLSLIEQKLDWKTIESDIWFNTMQDNNRKARKQAEFLIYEKLALDCIYFIGCFDEHATEIVKRKIALLSDKPEVKVVKKWYY